MKKKLFLSFIVSAVILTNCWSGNPDSSGLKSIAGREVSQMTNEDFKKLIFNYELNKEWKYEGTKPAIIDFYADWCAPCKQLSPLVEEIANEYAGKIIVYKVDTMKEKYLATKLGITGLPTLLFIPANGKPSVSMGFIPKESLEKAIHDVLLIK